MTSVQLRIGGIEAADEQLTGLGDRHNARRRRSAQEQNGGSPDRTHSRRYTDLEAAKLRGGYYTSSEVAAWLCAWAIRTPTDRVLEPSCGDGAFLECALERLIALGASGTDVAESLVGVEIVAQEADRARTRLEHHLGQQAVDVVETGDFFSWWQRRSEVAVDAVVGNPPFIRYQTFPEPHRSLAMEIMALLGLAPNRLTNIWVPFVAAAVARLKPGGRLALVLPAELLQVTYASQLRSFLTDRFARIDIVACNELFFEKAEQEVVLLLADGALAEASPDNPCRVALTETRSLTEITHRSPFEVLAGASPKTIRHDQEKWLKYFLSEREITFMRELRESAATTTLGMHAEIDVGVVTGKNEFFVLSYDQVEQLALNQYTVPLVSRSVQLKGAQIDVPEWQQLATGKDRVFLLHLTPHDGSPLPDSLARYVRFGEANDFHKGYKCSIRDPWYKVPSVWVPDGFVFRQIYDFPRAVLNKAGATSTDTIHRLRCHTEPARVIANLYSHLTSASAEIEGRSYGGGVLELEPTEAERLLVPARMGDALPILECDQLVRAGRLSDVLAENDRLLLREQLGLSLADCALLRDIWIKMRDRRGARRRGTRRTVTAGPMP